MFTSAFAGRSCAIAMLACIAPLPVSAQPVPDAGQVALGVDFGVFLPADEQLDPGGIIGGLIEFYATPRLGIRASLMAIRNGYDRPDDDEERQLRIGGDVIYNWEFGRVHPFAGGGLGLHLMRFYRDDEGEGPDDSNLGVSALGGAEFFLNRWWTFKLEGRYQWVGDRPNLNPDGLAVTGGFKRYF
jgi:opacity protein-like surface antigen